VVIPFLSSPARADTVLGDFSGILTDPLKLGHASDNILQAVERMQLMLNQAGSIEATTNADLAARIHDVKEIVDQVLKAVDQNVANLAQIIARAEATIASLEHTIYLDVEAILDKVHCLAENLATVQLQEAIVTAVTTLKAADPSIKIMGIKAINPNLKTVEVIDPDQMYLSLKSGYQKRLKALGEKDPAYTILSTYANIERVAENASCAYHDPTIKAMFLKEEFTYQMLAKPWSTVSVVMGVNP
jgi:Holliday junction resolvasome RuvABC endonuclease subunit